MCHFVQPVKHFMSSAAEKQNKQEKHLNKEQWQISYLSYCYINGNTIRFRLAAIQMQYQCEISDFKL